MIAGSVLIVLVASFLVGVIVVAVATVGLLYLRALDDPLPPPPPRSASTTRRTDPAADGARPDLPHVGKSTPPTSAH